MEIKDEEIYYGPLGGLVEKMKYKYMGLWWDTPTDFPLLKNKYNFWAKKHIEKRTDNFIDNLINKLNKMPNTRENIEIWKADILSDLKSFAKDTLGFKEKHLDMLFSDGYTIVTNEFIKKAREFNPDIDIFDIFQAIRNVWIMNSIQIFTGNDIEFTPSIFAYSMLYPYTDNYLDNHAYSLDTKKNFNNKFMDKLKGKTVKAENKNEEDIFKLVDIIEQQYPREDYREIFESLLAIHAAQDKSLVQQRGITFPYEKDILGISIEKGGTSVLADGYLVSGKPGYKEIEFAFGYGAFLQLSDDLQDIQEDIGNGNMTVFSSIAGKWLPDKITCRLFYFITEVLNAAEFKTSNAAELKDIIESSCNYLIFGAVSKNKRYFSRKFIKEIEQYSPFSFSYLSSFENKLRKRFSYVNINNIITALED